MWWGWKNVKQVKLWSKKHNICLWNVAELKYSEIAQVEVFSFIVLVQTLHKIDDGTAQCRTESIWPQVLFFFYFTDYIRCATNVAHGLILIKTKLIEPSLWCEFVSAGTQQKGLSGRVLAFTGSQIMRGPSELAITHSLSVPLILMHLAEALCFLMDARSWWVLGRISHMQQTHTHTWMENRESSS